MIAIRTATPDDAGLIFGFVRDLARHEDAEDKLVATEALLRRALEERGVEAAIAELVERHPDLEVVFVESGGDNLSATFSPELVDASIYVIDVAAGQVEVGDVCASASLAYTDADATAFGYARGQTPGQPGTFTGDPALLERLEQVGQEALRGATASSGRSRWRRARPAVVWTTSTGAPSPRRAPSSAMKEMSGSSLTNAASLTSQHRSVHPAATAITGS